MDRAIAILGRPLSRRGLAWLGFYLVILLSWVAVALMAASMPGAELRDMPASYWETLCLSAAEASPVALFLMWALMSSAMMLPTFVPAARTYDDLRSAGAGDARGLAALVGGYLVVWGGASVLGTGLQWFLATRGLLSPVGASLSPILTACLLAGAGLYQFSVLKAACLSKCRMPMTFFMERWRPGAGPAFKMGLELGAVCLGCCWALMLLGFVGGTMNLLWMGAATLFMTLEKLPDLGRPLTRPAGFALLAAAAYTLIF
jgi:predicted metal-binding membrane protein